MTKTPRSSKIKGTGNVDASLVMLNVNGQTAIINNRGRTIPHETGHGLGLRHPMGTPEFPNVGDSDPQSEVTTSESPQNVMRQSVDSDGTLLLIKQMNMMIQEVLNDTGQKLYQKSNGDPTWSPKDSSRKANKKFKLNIY